jgi:Uma2 family endonuclease
MILPTPTSPPQAIVYPESDGLPMADNSKQFRWIVTISTNLAGLFRDVADVYVIGNMYWYPVEGEPQLRQAPDIMVIFGRPKKDRTSYLQWEEDNVPVQVVFEALSPGNDSLEMTDKFSFYEEYGVEEYYLYNPENNQLAVYQRKGQVLRRVRKVADWTSPRLGIRFDLSGPELVVIYQADGQRFRTFEEIQTELVHR